VRVGKRTYTQVVLLVAAILVAVTMISVAQLARDMAQRRERAEVVVETIRADGQELNAIRAQALADALMRGIRRVRVNPASVTDGLKVWKQIGSSLSELQTLQPGVATRLRRDGAYLFSVGVTTLATINGKPVSPAVVTERLRFAQATDQLDLDAQRAATADASAAGDALRNAEIAFIGSLILGLLALVLLGARYHRLRRRLAVEAARTATEAQGEARLRALLEQSSDILTVVGTDLCVRWQAASITRILGHGTHALIGRPLTEVVHEDDVARVQRFLTSALTSSTSQPLTMRLSHADGGWRTVEAVANNRVADPAIGGLVLSMRDATERLVLADQLRHLAYHDSLTGLANRSLFENRLAQAVAIAQRSGREFAVVFVDIDDFKTINDSLGHASGDELLRSVAVRVQSILRPTDTAARLGGDEFAALLELSDESDAQTVAQRLLSELSLPFAIGGRELRATASLGVALTGHHTADELLRNADIAMYAAKVGGKAAVRTFEPDMHDRAVERLELTGELRAALERDEFVLVYQPIVELDSGRIAGLEALVRWRHPSRELVGPDQFIGLSEDTGLIVPLGRWILETACAQGRRWSVSYPDCPPRLSVNVSTRQLRDPEFVTTVADALDHSGLAPELLTLEITEGVLMGDREAIVGRLREIKSLGVRLAIDDFGTGYSSLSHLSQLPIDTLKIDKSFIDGIEQDPAKVQLVGGIVNLGQSLELELIAEGIEHPEQRRILAGMSAPLAQGFMFHPPLLPAEIDPLLAVERAAPVGASIPA
jgi:diguanylate cyclase (GGDEF)-like protein/PAS domain S-box-containing protein